MQVCTGNQDQTTRVYDVRNLSQSLVCLKGKMASVRGTHYSSDGDFLVAAEAADFVQIYDVKSGYKRSQVIGIFGEIAGVALSPDSDTLFISSADDTYGGIIELEKNQKRPLELL
jgi:WD40 repeat protein